jgi:hypothetical protein
LVRMLLRFRSTNSNRCLNIEVLQQSIAELIVCFLSEHEKK